MVGMVSSSLSPCKANIKYCLLEKSKMTHTDGEIYHVLGLEESIL